RRIYVSVTPNGKDPDDGPRSLSQVPDSLHDTASADTDRVSRDLVQIRHSAPGGRRPSDRVERRDPHPSDIAPPGGPARDDHRAARSAQELVRVVPERPVFPRTGVEPGRSLAAQVCVSRNGTGVLADAPA